MKQQIISIGLNQLNDINYNQFTQNELTFNDSDNKFQEPIDINLDKLLSNEFDISNTNLTDTLLTLEIYLLDVIIKVKSNNVGSIKIIRDTILETLKVINVKKYFATRIF